MNSMNRICILLMRYGLVGMGLSFAMALVDYLLLGPGMWPAQLLIIAFGGIFSVGAWFDTWLQGSFVGLRWGETQYMITRNGNPVLFSLSIGLFLLAAAVMFLLPLALLLIIHYGVFAH